MGKGVDIFALVSRGHRSDHIPLRESPRRARSFSDAMIANAGRFNLEHCNNITNSAGRRVWGFMGVEAIARPHINGFYGDSPCTYVPEDIPEEWRQVE